MMLLRIFNFDSSTVSEHVNMQQFIWNKTCVNMISWLDTLKFSLITPLADQISKTPCCVLQQLCLHVFFILTFLKLYLIM